MSFTFQQKILFKHCDPAGIVFYPRYFEIINDAVETLFDQVFHWPFEKLHQQGSVPTVSFNITFIAPSRHGDTLELAIRILRVGGASMTLDITARAGSETRFTAEQVLVHTDRAGRPRPWSAELRHIANPLVEDQT
ncbi:MAG: acyl-CoA thioesterase [Rhodobacteraceae bacterium]|nr:acyl-CoA thioesterase [Paracoccaceae bacterium]